ncbi:MAG TPA: DUF5678 domain-containing protein [Blastocatellia bacterium]|nr:DUF5678 domain-containing protein [Blastocatellia bacterium]HMV87588.1 DUF5678 domain-containing protein [Blastocatellia bacterium]HMY71334.1 DUF5678 domain-containing protein [Blastocatellia bacterium]HMZ19352.1 DUF5678 domain-containing protein [Blastocatellia bacterium]HNG34366.1 DUF5678 domain-containing protein [Blastocatellia bacterium]
MSEITYENVLLQAQQLPWQAKQKLLQTLAEDLRPQPSRETLQPLPWKDRSREYQWLKDHAKNYVGQWVALEGDELIAHGATAIEVLAVATASGIERPLLIQVEDPDSPPSVGF